MTEIDDALTRLFKVRNAGGEAQYLAKELDASKATIARLREALIKSREYHVCEELRRILERALSDTEEEG